MFQGQASPVHIVCQLAVKLVVCFILMCGTQAFSMKWGKDLARYESKVYISGVKGLGVSSYGPFFRR